MCIDTFVWTAHKPHKDTNGVTAIILFLAGKFILLFVFVDKFFFSFSMNEKTVKAVIVRFSLTCFISFLGVLDIGLINFILIAIIKLK